MKRRNYKGKRKRRKEGIRKGGQDKAINVRVREKRDKTNTMNEKEETEKEEEKKEYEKEERTR